METEKMNRNNYYIDYDKNGLAIETWTDKIIDQVSVKITMPLFSIFGSGVKKSIRTYRVTSGNLAREISYSRNPSGNFSYQVGDEVKLKSYNENMPKIIGKVRE